MTVTQFNPDTGEQFAWDATSMSNFTKCPRYYIYWMQGWTNPFKSVHLLFGGAYASAIEAYIKATVLRNMTHDEATVEAVRVALVESWEHQYDKEGNRIPGTGKPHPSYLTTNTKTRENLVRTVVWYLEEYKDSLYKTYITKDGRPAVEYSFKIELDSIIWCGHMDQLIHPKHNVSELYVQDQKTTGTTISASFFAQFDLSLQMSGYTCAGKIIYNTPVKGVMIDGAQIAVGFSRFMRGFTYRNSDNLEEFILEINATARYANKLWQEYHAAGGHSNFAATEIFPRNLSSCGNYGGCEYAGVCRAPRSLRKNLLASGFTRDTPWNPMKAR